LATRSELRRSQGVVPFGVGAIVDFKEESLMAAGLDVWPSELATGEQRAALIEACQVVDGRLADRLTKELKRAIKYFLLPAQAEERAAVGAQLRLDRAPMPFVRFPNWHFCPRCRVLKEIPWNTQSAGDTLRCSNLGRRVEGKGEPCGKLSFKRRPNLAPVRFVAACDNGHIMDFPWSGWAHKGANKACASPAANLYLYSTPAAGLAGVRVMCVECGASNSMAGAFREDVLADTLGRCPGHRPWLGPYAAEECLNVPQTIQRGASNAYFAKVVSSILIPPYSAKIRQILDRPDTWEEILSTTVDGEVSERFLVARAKNLGVDSDSFIKAVRERLGAKTDDGEFKEADDVKYRFDEYKAYLGPRPPRPERHDFDTDTRSASLYGPTFERLFERVVLVPKLRETRALTGFSRIVPPEALSGPLAQLSHNPKPWLPGFSVRGEGIFLQFRTTEIAKWSQDREEIDQRFLRLMSRSNDVQRQRKLPKKNLSPTFLLVHSFSHLLIRQLAFECGYDSSSIRERIYVSNDPETRMHGLLLYTASGDSEGTLGGLVRQGEPQRLEDTVRSAVRNALICSSDPLCIESEGQGLFSLNLAACHACSLLPETSCEEGNLLLDRALIVGRPGFSELGYFSAFLD
jgi:hypothetical protein